MVGARSRTGMRVRYVGQWLWGVPAAVVWLVPYALLWVAYVVAAPLSMMEVELPGPPGSGRRFRVRRMMWLSRDRLARECSTDTAWLEDRFRARLDGREPILLGRQSSGTVWRHRDGRIEIDDSYYRQFGLPRAVAIAAECGYAPAGGPPGRDATWLVLRHTAHGART